MVLQQQARAHLTIQVLVLPTTLVQALLAYRALAHPPFLQTQMLMAILSFHGSKTFHQDHHQHPLPSFRSCTFRMAPSVLQSLLQSALHHPESPRSELIGRISPIVRQRGADRHTPLCPLQLLQAPAARLPKQIGFPRSGFLRED